MPRRKLEDKNTRKLSKSTRGRYLVRLPVDFVRFLKWRDGSILEVDLDKKRKRLIIKKS